LRGEDEPTYTPGSGCEDVVVVVVVVVVNAGEVAMTGDELKKKLYRGHTG